MAIELNQEQLFYYNGAIILLQWLMIYELQYNPSN